MMREIFRAGYEMGAQCKVIGQVIDRLMLRAGLKPQPVETVTMGDLYGVFVDAIASAPVESYPDGERKAQPRAEHVVRAILAAAEGKKVVE